MAKVGGLYRIDEIRLEEGGTFEMVGLLVQYFMTRIHVCRWLLWLCLLASWMGDKTGRVIHVT